MLVNLFKLDDSFLPPIHRHDGKDPNHSDWPWPFKWVPRRWTAWPQALPPKMILGNQDYYNTAQPGILDSIVYGVPVDSVWPELGAKPISPEGQYQFSLSYPKIFGKAIPVPYFAVTKGGYTFYFGMRWSEGPGERYYNLAFFTIKKVRKSEYEL